ncbi:hypothetical protein QR680_006937 [Steinernema hermaphroditum]|uniref:PH domain-containing protein n=1 Tax=Steinernema hermaphroditum TaxID=289476 RepID=A0AA39HYL2_9BILA|nr:hypothetical protein QR680_006937 [Steinernema hermaphroditum]
MDRRHVKDGIIKRYQNIGRSWKKTYAVLYSDTTFEWYDKKGGSKAGSILLKHISPHIRVGQECDQLAVPRPNIPNEYSIHHLVAVGSNPSAERFFWFLCSSDEDFNSWHSQIVTTVLSCLLPQITTQTRSMPQTPATTLPSIGFEHLNSRDQTTVSTNPSGTYQSNVNRPTYPLQDNFPLPNRLSHLQLPSSSPQLPSAEPANGHLPTPTDSHNSTSNTSNSDASPSPKKKSAMSKFFGGAEKLAPVVAIGTTVVKLGEVACQYLTDRSGTSFAAQRTLLCSNLMSVGDLRDDFSRGRILDVGHLVVSGGGTMASGCPNSLWKPEQSKLPRGLPSDRPDTQRATGGTDRSPPRHE